jgi:hypothetical protein
MTTTPARLLCLSCIVLLGACQPKADDKKADGTTAAVTGTTAVASPSRPAFINKVWKVGASPNAAAGQLYVFLSDHTLVVTSGNGTPALGRWDYQQGKLSLTEEGRRYDTDILELSQQSLKIRSHNHGEPVDIELVPAEEPLPDTH